MYYYYYLIIIISFVWRCLNYVKLQLHPGDTLLGIDSFIRCYVVRMIYENVVFVNVVAIILSDKKIYVCGWNATTSRWHVRCNNLLHEKEEEKVSNNQLILKIGAWHDSRLLKPRCKLIKVNLFVAVRKKKTAWMHAACVCISHECDSTLIW